MSEYRVAITDSANQSVTILVRLTSTDVGTWRAENVGAFKYASGVTRTGPYPAAAAAWLSVFGGESADDSKLILHLDGFLSFTVVQPAGTGKVYRQDHVTMGPGDVKWRLEK